jgi:hypothetical protein
MVMYAPHILSVKRTAEIRDEYNRVSGVTEEWVELGGCRCDDNDTAQVTDDTGKAFIPRYHVVSERYDVKAGDYIRCTQNGAVRGEGEVRKVSKTNYLDYMSIYV